MGKAFFKINFLLLKETFFCMIFSFLVLGLVTLIGLNINFFSPFKSAFKDSSYLDLYYSEKLDSSANRVSDPIILMNINRLERKEIALVLDKLQLQKPKVIGLDVVFKERRDSISDQQLIKVLSHRNIVTTYTLLDKGMNRSVTSIVGPNAYAGYSNFSFDQESSVVRNFQGVKRDGDSIQLSFATAVAKKFLKNKWDNKMVSYLSRERPINFMGSRDNFLVLEYEDIINQDSIPILKDKIVLLGYLGSPNNHRFDIEDKHFTPMNEKFVGRSVPDTFGLVIHANLIHMLLTKDFIKVVPNGVIVFLTVLLTFISLCYFIWLNKQQLASYLLRLNLIRLLFIVIFVWLSLLLFKNKILFKTASIIAVAVFSITLIGYYKKLAHVLFKKFKWNGYFYQE